MKEIIIISPDTTFVQKFARKFDIKEAQISNNIIHYVQQLETSNYIPKYIFITLHNNSKSQCKYIEYIQSKFPESNIFTLLDKTVDGIKFATLFHESNVSILPLCYDVEIYSACIFLRENNYYTFPIKVLKRKTLSNKTLLSSKKVSFTKNENNVLINLAKGLSYQEVSEITAMKINTVRYYIKKIYKKLDVKNRHQCIQKYTKIAKIIK